MANSSTRKTTVDLPLADAFGENKATPILINYDTPDEDLIISQVDDKVVYLVGWELVSQYSFNFSLKSGSTVLTTLQFSANAGQGEPFTPQNPGIICNTEAGEALTMNCDQALPPFLVYVVEV